MDERNSARNSYKVTALLGFELDGCTDAPNKKANQPKQLICLLLIWR